MALAQQGSWWRDQRTPGPASTEEFRGAVIGPNRLILVGEDSGAPIIYTAPTSDLQQLSPTYTQKTPAGSSPLYAVDYATDIAETVAVGTAGSVETSLNQGLNWTSQTLAGAPNLLDVIAVAGAASRFVATAIGVIWGRDVGGTWTTRWTGALQWFSVAYRAGAGWVAVGNAGWATQSPTAANGSFISPYQPLSGTAPLNKIRANASYFIAVGDTGRIYRSATGLPGSWIDLSFETTSYDLTRIIPTASDNNWAIGDALNRIWYSTNNGASWTQVDRVLLYPGGPMATSATAGIAAGQKGYTYVSYDQTQADFVSTAEAQTVPAAFSPNADMAGDAVRRLVTQFRSGT